MGRRNVQETVKFHTSMHKIPINFLDTGTVTIFTGTTFKQQIGLNYERI